MHPLDPVKQSNYRNQSVKEAQTGGIARTRRKTPCLGVPVARLFVSVQPLCDRPGVRKRSKCGASCKPPRYGRIFRVGAIFFPRQPGYACICVSFFREAFFNSAEPNFPILPASGFGTPPYAAVFLRKSLVSTSARSLIFLYALCFRFGATV
jgi:hypothetical protein